MIDTGENSEQLSYFWAVLRDKGYTGAERDVGAIIPCKKPPKGLLSVSDREQSKNISSDRVVVENYFERLCTFGFIGSEWTWGQSEYNLCFNFSNALTNAHIIWNPLRASVENFNCLVASCLVFIEDHSSKNGHSISMILVYVVARVFQARCR